MSGTSADILFIYCSAVADSSNEVMSIHRFHAYEARREVDEIYLDTPKKYEFSIHRAREWMNWKVLLGILCES